LYVSPGLARSGKYAHWKRNLALVAVAACISSALFAAFYVNSLQYAPVNTAKNPVTVDSLVGAYMDNPTTADSLFANKTYYVTGVPLSLQQDPNSGRYYSDFVLAGFIQFYWKDFSEASKVTPCADALCQPILAKCFLAGFAVRTGGNEIIMMNNCEFIH